jgi:hypothetical protein
MMDIQKIKASFLKAHEYSRSQNYTGYSLYDSHNGVVPFEKFGRVISFYSNQIIKRSPINFRTLLGIKKGYNPKGAGLFLNIYSQAAGLGIIEEGELKEITDFFFEWLINNPSQGYSGYCWGYNYDWPIRDGSIVPAHTPSGVVTGFNCRAMMSNYRICNNEKVREIIASSADFVMNDLEHINTDRGLCISYTPLPDNLTVNASLLGAEILAYSDYLNGTKTHRDTIKGVLDFTRNVQNDDGSWYYSFTPGTFKPKNQIDFHQGYVIETIDNILKHISYDFDITPYRFCIHRGLDFYLSHQIDPKGYAYWRLPKKWPVDIHNQSQAIITLNRFDGLDVRCKPLRDKIISWTIENMMGSNGKFYYQKWPLITNKVSYMRWNQAWMMLALMEVLKKNSAVTSLRKDYINKKSAAPPV